MLTLPPDLQPDEQATADALRARAVEIAERDAALIVRVRREVRRLHGRGLSVKAACAAVADDGYPVSARTAERIWRGTWRA